MKKEAEHLLLIVILLPPVFPLQLSTYVYIFDRTYGKNMWNISFRPKNKIANLNEMHEKYLYYITQGVNRWNI